MFLLLLLTQLVGPGSAPGTPPPPPQDERTELPPEYVADCHLVDAVGRIARLRVEVGNFPQPNGRIVSADPALAYLRQPSLVMSRVSMPDGLGGWDMSDTIMIQQTSRGDVGVRLETRNREPLASVALISTEKRDWGRTYEAGMCGVQVKN